MLSAGIIKISIYNVLWNDVMDPYFCRNEILKSRHGINDVIHLLKHEDPMANDGTMQKYLTRLKSKLKKQQHPS